MDHDDVIMLQDIEQRVSKTLYAVVQDYEQDCSLAIPAVLLKMTLQIYKQVMADEDTVAKIILASLNELRIATALGVDVEKVS